jgi:transcriptional regulator with XRE-family HTH domain
MISGRQIRAARALLGIDIISLAEAAEITRNTLAAIEQAARQPHKASLSKVVQVLNERGIEFTSGDGVRMRSTDIEVFVGPERFDAFYDFLYEKIKARGGDICLSVTDETLLARYRTDSAVHYKRMQELSDRNVITSFRILANKSNFAAKYSYNIYKWQRAASLAPTAFYTFADCLALISFSHPTPPYVLVVQSAPLSAAYVEAFNAAWQAAENPPRPKSKK